MLVSWTEWLLPRVRGAFVGREALSSLILHPPVDSAQIDVLWASGNCPHPSTDLVAPGGQGWVSWALQHSLAQAEPQLGEPVAACNATKSEDGGWSLSQSTKVGVKILLHPPCTSLGEGMCCVCVSHHSSVVLELAIVVWGSSSDQTASSKGFNNLCRWKKFPIWLQWSCFPLYSSFCCSSFLLILYPNSSPAALPATPYAGPQWLCI